MYRIWILSASEAFGRKLQDYLQGMQSFYSADWLAVQAFDCMVLDLGARADKGVPMVQEARARYPDVALVVCASSYQIVELVGTLEAGADAFWHREYSASEWQARLHAFCRRAVGTATAIPAPPCIGNAKVWLQSSMVECEGQQVPLAYKERRILECLLRKRGQVVPRMELLKQVWGLERGCTPRVVDTCVVGLRKKLMNDNGKAIKSVFGVGYVLDLAESP